MSIIIFISVQLSAQNIFTHTLTPPGSTELGILDTEFRQHIIRQIKSLLVQGDIEKAQVLFDTRIEGDRGMDMYAKGNLRLQIQNAQNTKKRTEAIQQSRAEDDRKKTALKKE